MLNKQWKIWSDEIVSTIESIEYRTEPFYYFYCEPFLPAKLFDHLKHYWPKNQCFWGQSEIADSLPNHEHANLRKVIIIDDAPGYAKQPDAVEFWRNFREMLRGPTLLDAFITKSFDYIREVRKDLNLPTIQCWSNALLEYDTDGFHLGPHLDSPTSLLSLLLYLPHEGSPEDQGTSIYKPKEEFLVGNPELYKKFSTCYYNDEDFNETYRAPYRPNGLFCTVNEPRAFHGVKKLDQPEFVRRHILWSITTKESNPYPSALERVKWGVTPESQLLQNRMKSLIEKKLAFTAIDLSPKNGS
jgi:hypothetical protein